MTAMSLLACSCSPVIQHTVLLLAEMGVAAAVAGCQLAHGGASALADVVQADSAPLGPVHMAQVQPAAQVIRAPSQGHHCARR